MNNISSQMALGCAVLFTHLRSLNLHGDNQVLAWQAEKLAETKGLNFADREKAKHHAQQQAAQMYDNSDYSQ